jgi:uncharacterized membrane protein (DUF4010 family)
MDIEALLVLRSFAVSLIIGLVIGVERERAHRPHTQSLGMRTFALLSLLGTLTAILEPAALQACLALFALLAILLGYWKSTRPRQRDPQLGLTTEIAGAIVYGLGALAPREPMLAAVLGLVVLLLLISKQSLHHFARKSLSAHELRAFITLLIIALGLLPILPNHAIDPWGLINPQRLGIILAVLATMQFVGYVLARLLGHRAGSAIIGFLGGLISSTIVFMHAARTSQVHSKSNGVAAAATLSAVSSYMMLWLVIALTAPALGWSLMPCMIGLIASGVLMSAVVLFRKDSSQAPSAEYSNPLDLRSVAKLTVFFAGMLAFVGLTQKQLGSSAVHLISLVGGLFELHSTSVASATMLRENLIEISSAKENIALALLGSFVSKFFIVFWLMKGPSRNRLSLILMIMLAASATGYGLF